MPVTGTLDPITAGTSWVGYAILRDQETGLPMELNNVDTGALNYGATMRVLDDCGRAVLTLTNGSGIDDPSPALGAIQWRATDAQTRALCPGIHRLTLDLETTDGTTRVIDARLPVMRF